MTGFAVSHRSNSGENPNSTAAMNSFISLELLISVIDCKIKSALFLSSSDYPNH